MTAAALSIVQHWVAKIADAREISRARRELMSCNDYMLHDMGITRGEIDFVVRYGHPRGF